MDAATHSALHAQLAERRQRLQGAVEDTPDAKDLVRLLQQVDAALNRMATGTYSDCEVCHEPISEDDVAANPLIRYCLCELTRDQQRALEDDFDLATRLQASLLPDQDMRLAGWQVHYRYEPAGPVSGDYCDLIVPRNGRTASEFFFVVGDVSGKGFAASLLMAHLNAVFRSLITVGFPVPDLVARANLLFLERSISTHYATLVCGRAGAGGEIEICNAGHCLPLHVAHDGGRVTAVESTGLPVGVFGDRPYSVRNLRLAPGDTLFIYTDGLVEAFTREDEAYGVERLARMVAEHRGAGPRGLARACLDDLSTFLAGAPRNDDLTLMALTREPS